LPGGHQRDDLRDAERTLPGYGGTPLRRPIAGWLPVHGPGGWSFARLLALGTVAPSAPARSRRCDHCVALGGGDRGLRLCATALARPAVASAGRPGRSDPPDPAPGPASPDHTDGAPPPGF